MKKFQTGFVFGNFYVLHLGHIRFLRYAANICERLIIGVRDTYPNNRYSRPDDRAEALAALRFGDAIVITPNLSTVLREHRPDVVIQGDEYRNIESAELSVIKEWNGELIFSSGDNAFNSSELVSFDRPNAPEFFFLRPSDFIRRNCCGPDHIRTIIKRFKTLTFVVAGDLIVDDYIDCDPVGMSSEDPTIVVSPVNSQRFVGGAGIVASHARALGAQVSYCGLVGDDEAGRFAEERLSENGVRFYRFSESTRPTTLKQRFRCRAKTLLRVNRYVADQAKESTQNLMINVLQDAMANSNGLILSDFSYGCLGQSLIDRVIDRACSLGITTSADSQSSAHLGDSSKFRGVQLLCATEQEARLAIHDNTCGLSVLATKLQERTDAKVVFLKLGSSGVIICSKGMDPSEVERIPALNSTAVDVAGAGDSMLAAASLAFAAGASALQAAYIGSIASAIQVGRVGNRPISDEDLLRALH